MLLMGKLTISMAIFNSFLLVYQRVSIHFFEQHSLYQRVNVNKKLWKITMLLMGKLTISMAIFNSYVTNYQAG